MGLSAVDSYSCFCLKAAAVYFARMLALGFTEEKIGEAFNEARRAGFTEATGVRGCLVRVYEVGSRLE